jgi:hypothetical protein
MGNINFINIYFNTDFVSPYGGFACTTKFFGIPYLHSLLDAGLLYLTPDFFT